MHTSLAFLVRMGKASRKQQQSKEGSGFNYIITPRVHNADTGRWALVRPYTLPKVDFAGLNGSHGIIQRSIGGPSPAIGTSGNTVLNADPRGFAGNSPTTLGTSFSPLIDNNTVNISNQQFGSGNGAIGA